MVSQRFNRCCWLWVPGKRALEAQVDELEGKFPGKVKGIVQFSVRYAHLITAGAALAPQLACILA